MLTTVFIHKTEIYDNSKKNIYLDIVGINKLKVK